MRLASLREPWSDHRAERSLGAVAVSLCLLVILIALFVASEAWPTLRHNDVVGWLLPLGDGNVDADLARQVNSGLALTGEDYRINAWPLVYATALTTGFAVLLGTMFAVFSSIFIVEFCPAPLRRIIIPIVRLLAAVPSVIYGLLGILVVAKWVSDNLISVERKTEVQYVVQLTGTDVLVATLILTIMITPIMIAIITDALYAVPKGWREGSIALGVNRWRAMWTISVRACRPAIIAAAVLATARALGEAIMLSMVSGSRGFEPNPLDGLSFFFEPLRPLGATIAENVESLNAPALRSSVYAFALVLLFSSFMLSVAGYLAKQSMKRYGARA